VVGADATRQHQTRVTGLTNRTPTLDYQRVHHRLFKGARNVGPPLFLITPFRHFFPQGIERKSFKATEAEIQTWPIRHRAGKMVTPWLTPLRQCRQRRPTGIGQPQ